MSGSELGFLPSVSIYCVAVGLTIGYATLAFLFGWWPWKK